MRQEFLIGFLSMVVFVAGALPAAPKQQVLTLAPAGPYHVNGNQILDSKGRVFLMRGTQVREFRPRSAALDSHSSLDFGPHSATSLGAIRLRFNMNTVRVPLNILDAANPAYFTELAKLVRRAHDAELLVVLAARDPDATLPSAQTSSLTRQFWARAAEYFREYPDVFFEVPGDPVLVHVIRAAGATQPVIVPFSNPLSDDANLIYAVAPRFSEIHTDAQRRARFDLASRVPMFAAGWDVELDDVRECSTLPSDPATAGALVAANLEYFDAHKISWSVSIFEPGKLIRDLSLHDATTLENGWTCGPQGYPSPGMGRIVQAHMRATEERGFFAVSASGSIEIPRGGFAVAYGPVMAERDTVTKTAHFPQSMGGLHVNVTDSKGVTRLADIYGATAGWGQINFVIPEESAVGPARMTVVREDGSSSTALITIADTAPGFWTGMSCRGAAAGSATQVFADGRSSQTALSFCRGYVCETIPVPVENGASTRVRLRGSGFRFAGSASKIVVTIAGVRVPVVSFGPTDLEGIDQVTIEIPAKLRGLGEADLISRVNGRASNPVRIRIGGGKPLS